MSLLTVERYVELTGDSTSPSASVSGAIGDAERVVAEYLRRPLEQDEYTDRLHIDTDGRVYPKATPLVSVDDDDLSILDDRTIGWATSTPDFITEWTSRVPTGYLVDQPLRSVTYTGGWTADTAPFSVLRTIARVAYRIANPRSITDDDFAGATSRSVADASVSWSDGAPGSAGGRSEMEALAPGAEAALIGYRWTEDYA